MDVIMSFFPSSSVILIILLFLFNTGNKTGMGSFVLTVSQFNIIEGEIAFDMTEGKEKINVKFTQKLFIENGEIKEQSEQWLYMFGKHKTYSIDNVNKTYKENDIVSSIDKIMKEKFSLDREEKSVFYKSDIGPGKIACFSKADELSEHYIIRIKDKNMDNLITSIEIRSNDVMVHGDFFPSKDIVNSDNFEIPGGYKKIE